MKTTKPSEPTNSEQPHSDLDVQHFPWLKPEPKPKRKPRVQLNNSWALDIGKPV